MSAVIVSLDHISETLDHLKVAGLKRSECVVLWFGRKAVDGIVVERVWRPPQRAGSHFFEIPSTSMIEMFKELRSARLIIAAQIHSHPQEAFHSHADDKWAIIRHEGALSLVLPDFALKTDRSSFLAHMVSFKLSALNNWEEIDPSEMGDHLRIK